MPTTKLVSQMRGEVFSVFGPGCYVLVGTLFVLPKTLVAPIPDSNITSLAEIAKIWPIFFLLFLFAYMIGVLIRAIPVNLSDKISKASFYLFIFLLSLLSQNERFGFFFKNKFPYPFLLKEYKDQLGWDISTPFRIDEIEERPWFDFVLKRGQKSTNFASWVPHTYFNFIKMILCHNGSNTYFAIQAFESRVRLASGMFWAGFVGLIVALVVPVYSARGLTTVLSEQWIPAYGSLSMAIVVLFGVQIPRLRGQEAVHVYLAYFAYLKSPPSDNGPRRSSDDSQ